MRSPVEVESLQYPHQNEQEVLYSVEALQYEYSESKRHLTSKAVAKHAELRDVTHLQSVRRLEHEISRKRQTEVKERQAEDDLHDPLLGEWQWCSSKARASASPAN